ncbi:hypothetical protein ACJIZ3_006318 [Penstemon smallii]|uniref:GB1/RHD3-type G domain-containing protein n=1 Tax=Penstemon smallii TaxID=265156 RepID=A0ABD3S7I3_9LAMI
MKLFSRGSTEESPSYTSTPPSPALPAPPSNISAGPARPIRLVYCDDRGKFHMDPEAVALLQLVKEPVGIVSVCGRARQGKSFILNQLLGQSSGFQVASTHRPCTKGLWLWSIPLRRTALDGTVYNLLLLDSEGIDAYDQTGTYSTQIFSLAVLLSSMFIYNQMGGIDEAALDRLSLVTEMTKHIRVRASGGRSTTSELAQFSPIFVWLLRDFYLDLVEDNRKITPRDYLELALRPVEGGKKDVAAKNEIRESIRALFPDRECFPLVRPLSNENDLQRLDQIPLEKLRPEFRSGLDALTRFVFERTRPKQVGGTVMTGPIFARITQSFLDALNNGAVPTITSSWQSVEEAECQRAYALGTEVYTSAFDKSKPPEEAAMREAHEDAVQKSMATFNDTAVGAGLIRQKYEKRLQSYLKKAFEDIKKDAFREAYLQCTKTIEKMEKELRKACQAPDAKLDTVLKVLDGLLDQYEATCHGPEKWRKAIVFLQQSLEGPILDLIKKQIDQIGSEKSSLALKCRSTEEKLTLLNKQLEASENYKSEYLKRYEDAINEKKRLADDYMSRITNLQKKCSSLEEKSSNLSKTLDEARQESVDWKRKHELVLSKQKAGEEQYISDLAMLRSKSSAAEARLGAAREKAQSALDEAEEWKRKYDIAVREAKDALQKAAAIQDRATNQTQSREANLRTEFSGALAEKENEIKEQGKRLEQAEQRLTTLNLELKVSCRIKYQELRTRNINLKQEIKDLTDKVESANATAISAQSKAGILEQEKTHLEQKYRAQFDRFAELEERSKSAEKEAKRAIEMADQARSEAVSAQKDKTKFNEAERRAENLERQKSDLSDEVERYKAAEREALFKVEMLENRVKERKKKSSHLCSRTIAKGKVLLQYSRVYWLVSVLHGQKLKTQSKLDQLSQELTTLRFSDKTTLDGKVGTTSHAKRVRTDDYEMGVALHSSPLKFNSPEDGGSVFRGDEQTNSPRPSSGDYSRFTIAKLRQVLTEHNFAEQLLQLKNPNKKDLIAL